MLKIKVPSSEYPTLESALGAISIEEVEFELAPGTYYGNWTVSWGQKVKIRGAGEDLTFLDGQGKGSVFRVESANIHISDLTIQNGRPDTGGGVCFLRAEGLLVDITFAENKADDGGGVWLENSSLTLVRAVFAGNTASNRGGGVYLFVSSPFLLDVTFKENMVSDGGGMYLGDSDPILVNVSFANNNTQLHTDDSSRPVILGVTGLTEKRGPLCGPS